LGYNIANESGSLVRADSQTVGYIASNHVSTGCVLHSDTAASARSNCTGRFFPRFSARRRIPLQAVALKKNRCGTLPVSKTSDNEHTTAALGHSKVLSVKNSVGEPIPEFPQPSKEGGKIVSSVTG